MTASQIYRIVGGLLLLAAGILTLAMRKDPEEALAVQAGILTVADVADRAVQESRFFWAALVCGATGVLVLVLTSILDALSNAEANRDRAESSR